MATRVTTADAIAEMAQISLDRITEEKNTRWEELKAKWSKKLDADCLESSKRTWYRWFPKPFAPISDEEVTQFLKTADAGLWRSYWSKIFNHDYEKHINTLCRVRNLAQCRVGVNNSITIDDLEWNILRFWNISWNINTNRWIDDK